MSYIKNIWIAALARIFRCWAMSGFIILLIPASLLAQSQTDSLLTLLQKAPVDTNKVLVLNKLSRSLLYDDPQQALKYALQGDSLAHNLDYFKGKVLSRNRIGSAYWSLGDLEQGLSYFIQSKELAEEINDRYLVGKNIGNMGIIYGAAGNHELAIKYYRQSLPIFQELQNQERLAVTYNNLGKSYLELAQYDSAIYYLEQAEPLAKAQSTSLLSYIYIKMAEVCFRQEAYDKASYYLQMTQDLSVKYQDKRGLALVKQMLAEIQLKVGSTNEALDLSQSAVQLADETASRELQYITYQTYSSALAASSRFDSAYYYQKRSSELREDLQSNSHQERLNLMQFDNQRKEIGQLLLEKDQEKTARKQQRAQIFLLYGLLIVTAILIILLYRSRGLKLKSNRTLQQRNEEIKEQKENIAIQAEQLQELNTTKDKILSIISHDLKSPLNSIAGSLNLLQEGLLTREEFQRFVPDLNKNVSYTSSMLDNLLHWAKNQLGRGNNVNPENINLRKLTLNKVELLSPQASQKGVTLQAKIDQPMVVYADDIMIQIVLQNLISNAIKFCNQGDNILVSAQQKGQDCIVSVSDTGLGISQENLEKLFSRESFTTRGTANEKGTGLGLQLCQDFVEKNGGKIWAKSKLGEGSSFYFSLPVYDLEPQLQ